MSHGDKIKNIPQDWLVTSKSENNIISSVECDKKYLRCTISPRVVHTINYQIIKNFTFGFVI